MKLSIITINRNNAAGLEKTLRSAVTQTCKDFEHIIIDGASTDNSVEVIKRYVESINNSSSGLLSGVEGPDTHHQIRWISEPDKGIYNAMNKGIRMASGDYIQILNSADCLCDEFVVEKMLKALADNKYPSLLYGNMIKVASDGRIVGKSGGVEYSLRQYYSSTMNHDCCYIKRSLFEEYGLYDESLKIVSDWKWFLQAIGLGNVKPVYTDLDVTLFDTNGISETNLELRNKERRQVLENVMPPAVLADYDKHAFDMDQMDRLHRHGWAYKVTWFLERSLFKLEKWKQ